MDSTSTETATQTRRNRWKPVETEELSGGGPAGRGIGRRRPGAMATVVAFLGLIGLATGCNVPPPTVQQGLDYGFQTPEQAFESWRTAVQGNLLAKEYACFSREWRDNNKGIGIQGYAEARDKILEEYPYLRRAVYGAEAPVTLTRTDNESLLQSRIPGLLWVKDRYLLVKMRRQAFWELTAEESPRQPEYGDLVLDPFKAQILYHEEPNDRFQVLINDFEHQARAASFDSVHLICAGWEWKIEEFWIVDEKSDERQLEP